MSRMYIVNHWNNAAAYSGEQIGDRLKDSTALHFNRDGSANTELYSEETALAKKKTSSPLTDRILPQAKRVNLLTEQMRELEIEYKSGKMSITDYTLYRNILSVKRSRAEVLLRKAVSVCPTSHEDDEFIEEYPQDEAVYEVNSSVIPTIHTGTWIDDLPASNSLKLPLQKTLQVAATLVRLSHKARSYWQELKEV